ncbi:unnamed protein product, partial [Mesorhabditis belari]|uniref:Uncharacterized protein n=1 Tax=Mesorhabditis belari TaxID=2138241 RepID=A0AAF3J582_9BILA
MEGCPLTYYLGELPQALLKKGKLSEICRVTTIKEDNTQEIFYRQTYILQNDSMLVTTQSISNSSARISTIHKNRGVSAKYQNRIDEFACGDLASDTKELLDKMITLRISFEREDFVDAQAQAAENIIDLVE